MTNEEKRDMTVRLAERVMGWRFIAIDEPLPDKGEAIVDCGAPDELRRYIPSQGFLPSNNPDARGWNPLDNIADAWMVVEAMRKRGFQFAAVALDACEATFQDIGEGCDSWSADAQTMPEAICRAALSALEGE